MKINFLILKVQKLITITTYEHIYKKSTLTGLNGGGYYSTAKPSVYRLSPLALENPIKVFCSLG